MYIAVVMLVGRMIRGLVMNAGMAVMVSEIPNPDHLLKICLDIYLVREAKDFVLEQVLAILLIVSTTFLKKFWSCIKFHFLVILNTSFKGFIW